MVPVIVVVKGASVLASYNSQLTTFPKSSLSESDIVNVIAPDESPTHDCVVWVPVIVTPKVSVSVRSNGSSFLSIHPVFKSLTKKS